VAARRRAGMLGREAADGSPMLAQAIDSIASGHFSPDDHGRFLPLTDAILGADDFMIAADFGAYWQAQRAVDDLWKDEASWWRMSILNTCRMGWFSSDRTIREYADEIWHVPTR
jgi:glycogen phosphorylase